MFLFTNQKNKTKTNEQTLNQNKYYHKKKLLKLVAKRNFNLIDTLKNVMVKAGHVPDEANSLTATN